MKNIICPISPLRIDEHVIRFTALCVIILVGVTVLQPNYFIPMFLVADFYIRAFTKARFSPLSWVSFRLVKFLKLKPALIDKAPKIFAARIGLVLTALMLFSTIIGWDITLISIGSILMLFAFLECVFNFCAGCWIYTYIILPIYKDN